MTIFLARLGPQLMLESIVGGQDSTYKVLHSHSKDDNFAGQNGPAVDA